MDFHFITAHGSKLLLLLLLLRVVDGLAEIVPPVLPIGSSTAAALAVKQVSATSAAP
jgi:hypothetical protein